MTSVHEPDSASNDLSLEEMEELLREKRRHLTERKVRSFDDTERLYTGGHTRGELDDPLIVEPLPSPEHWRGFLGREREFLTLEVTPIGVSATGTATLAGRTVSLRGDGASATLTQRQGWDIVQATLPTDATHADQRALRDRVLLAVELAALLVFVLILGNSYLRLKDLNREVRDAQSSDQRGGGRGGLTRALRSVEATGGDDQGGPPSMTLADPAFAPKATPVTVLPGGHLPPGAGSVPPHLSGLVRSSVPLNRPPTPGPDAPRRLVIPSLRVDGPVVAGDSPEALKKGIGHRSGSVNPGEPGNMVVSAHNDIYGELFRDLAKLEPGDEVLVYTDEVAFRYVVNRVEIVAPTKVDVMDPTDHAVLTMITCYPYLLDTHRVVAVADLAS